MVPPWWLLLLLAVRGEDLHLTTDDEGYLTVIQGFATQLQCVLNTCSPNVLWYKDDLLLYNGTEFVNTSGESATKLRHRIDVDYEKGCTGQCSDAQPCGAGQACVDNQCCACAREDFTLVLKNLTFEDSGRYRCQIANRSELLEFHVEVLESGLKGGFHETIEYDYSECCQEHGISSTCRAMCKPSEMAEHSFDPTSCKTEDYKSFITCATQNNTRNHIHCCKTQLVPSFCYDFCGDFQMLRRSHKLCLYYLETIMTCYDRAYLPYPDPPESLQVNAVDHDKLQVCWRPLEVHSNNEKYPVNLYTVSYKEIPNFPLFGGEMGIPLLTGDYSEIADLEDGDYEDAEAHSIKTRSIEEQEQADPSEMGELKEKLQIRRKRANIVVITRDSETNTTAVREFAFQHVNTTDTCLTLTELRAATRYVIVVTARNSFGASVPSVRALASTNAQIVQPSDKLPDPAACCKTNGVTEVCAKKMCTVETPTSMETISISTSCRSEWPKVAPCIADQRNHTDCCLRKNVQSDCLPICAGSTDPLGVHSVLCLNLDIHAIYQCIREGYVSHPSPPVNVSVHEITESSAEITWGEPATNAHLVQNYTLFLRKAEHGAPVRQVHNAVSPHTELGLDSDSEYSVSVQSNSAQGASLPSTAIVFSTRPFDMPRSSCPIGEPLLLEDHRIFVCSPLNLCPSGFRCTEDGEEAVCCQTDGFNSDSDFQECCTAQGVSNKCMQYCFFNATHLPDECKGELNRWVQCGSQGQDHSRCCEQEAIPKECTTGCRHPFQVPDSCLAVTKSLMTCFAGRSSRAPTAPKNVRVSLIRHNTATISWEELDYNVLTFQVDLFLNRTLVQSHNTTVDVLRLEDLRSVTQYYARVIGYNEVGAGPPSWNVTFVTLPEKDSEGDRPKQPENVRISWNNGVKVNITWDAVTLNRNGEQLKSLPVYHLYYNEADTSGTQVTIISSNNTWAIMSDLRRDALYSVYVTAEEGKNESRSSSVITLIAQPDKYGLPEPELLFEPEYGIGIYNAGDKIHINCTLGAVSKQGRHFNMDLNVGTHAAQNDHGETWVAMDVQADSTLDTASCAVTDTDGRQTVNLKHILVRFGPVVKMNSSTIRAFGPESARIICTAEGFPAPTISFEKDGKSVNEKFPVSLKLLHGNVYQAILNIPRTRGNEGIYECIADMDGQKSRDKTELIIAMEKHPQNPRYYLDCCEQEKIEGDCLQACTLGKVPVTATNCTQLYGKSMLHCAEDVRDHSDCCAAALIPKQCLPLCSGDVPSISVDCTPYAVHILSCFVKGHAGSPAAVTGTRYELLDRNSVKISWDEERNLTQYQYYVVYYKRKGTDDDYKQSKSRFNSVTIPVEDNAEYEAAIVAANAAGHSPLVFLDINDIESSSSKQSSHTWLYVLFVMILLLVVVGNVYVFGWRRHMPSSFGKLFRGGAVPNDATVAFENPAYVSGNEVEIRGLGRPEWQQQELVSGGSDDDYRNGHSGTRYSKLRNAQQPESA